MDAGRDQQHHPRVSDGARTASCFESWSHAPFTYSASGDEPTGGVIESFTQHTFGTLDYRVSGLSVDAISASAALNRYDIHAALTLAASGDDTFNLSQFNEVAVAVWRQRHHVGKRPGTTF